MNPATSASKRQRGCPISYNGSGTFQVNSAGQPVVTATVISSTVFNAYTADVATGLTNAICKDGQSACTARIPFANGINSTLTTDATSTITGSILTAGGIGCVKALWVGGLANIAGALTVQSTLTATTSITASNLTAGRVTFAGASGLLTDDADLTFATDTLTGTKIIASSQLGVGAANNILSGTYTPTLTNAANLDASTTNVCQYLRVGNVVTVSGLVDVDPTTNGSTTRLGISLPIASTIANVFECAGTASGIATASNCAAIRGDTTNHRAEMIWVAIQNSNQNMYFSFTYLVT